MLLVIIGLIRVQQQQLAATRAGDDPHRIDHFALSPDQLQAWFPQAASLGPASGPLAALPVLDDGGRELGHVLQTAPDSDRLVGFSGPPNVLLGVGLDRQLRGIRLLSSGDTAEHVEQVRASPSFFAQFKDIAWGDSQALSQIDAVSGASLTCMAIVEAVQMKMGGPAVSLRFPDGPPLDTVRQWFSEAKTYEPTNLTGGWYRVLDRDGRMIGHVLRTSPAGDQVVGYQGPSDCWLAIDPDGKVVATVLGDSYDNQPYVRYVREEAYFWSLFQGQHYQQFADWDEQSEAYEGVSGATMTSQAVVRGVRLAVHQLNEAIQDQNDARLREEAAAKTSLLTNVYNKLVADLRWNWRDAAMLAVVALAVLLGFSSLRGRRGLRRAYQCMLIVFLGLTLGGMVSQAMWVGWAQHGVPWQTAGGLVALSLAALSLPVLTGRNLYCNQICPHGAVQQIMLSWSPARPQATKQPAATRPVRLARWFQRQVKSWPFLRWLPGVLLAYCLVVAMTDRPNRLVSLEPFDAWTFPLAGLATILVAVVGLVVSYWVPMAYCRYGCPTGALLNFLRWNGRSDRWTARDWWAVTMVLLAAILLWAG